MHSQLKLKKKQCTNYWTLVPGGLTREQKQEAIALTSPEQKCRGDSLSLCVQVGPRLHPRALEHLEHTHDLLGNTKVLLVRSARPLRERENYRILCGNGRLDLLPWSTLVTSFQEDSSILEPPEGL